MSEHRGYLYRRDKLTAEQLRELFEQQVFGDGEVLAFAANTVELLPICPCPTAAEVPLKGRAALFDFGHVFSQRAEVRWQRRGDNYDALVLAETPLTELAGSELMPPENLTAVEAPPKLAILLDPPHGDQKCDTPVRLGYVEYRVWSGAVQFVRYTGRR